MESFEAPQVTLKTREDGKWVNTHTADLYKDKKIVIFALPGAFTPTCSSTHAPGYEEEYNDIIKTGIDEIYCISVNDAFVMNAWKKDLGICKVKMLPDGAGEFAYNMNMLVEKPAQGFGKRSWRYSMVVDNGVVVKMFAEKGINGESSDNDPFEVSDAITMLNYLQETPIKPLTSESEPDSI